MNQRWLNYFNSIVSNAKSMSKDANTQVGAVIFSEEHKVEISSGWNCAARGVEHSSERSSRPLKYKFTTHAEANCIANAARLGRATHGMSLMVSLFPCTSCAGLIINAGIKKVYAPKPDYSHAQYGEDFKLSEIMFKEAGVEVVEYAAH